MIKRSVEVWVNYWPRIGYTVRVQFPHSGIFNLGGFNHHYPRKFNALRAAGAFLYRFDLRLKKGLYIDTGTGEEFVNITEDIEKEVAKAAGRKG